MGTIKLFVVDDEVDFTEFVADVAENMAFDVSFTSNPLDFARRYNADIDIIVLDLFMPIMDGIEILRFLADHNSPASLIFMSGKDKGVLRSAQELAFEQGMAVLGVLQKPFRASELEALLSTFVPTANTQTSHSAELPGSDELREAINNGDLFLAYQPQINMSDRSVVGVEALIRWNHPSKGKIAPNYFIPLAEKNHLISDISQYVNQAAIRQQGEWKAQGIHLRMSINVSPQILNDLDMPEKLARYATEMGVDTSDIVIE